MPSDQYPLRYRLLILKDGVVLKLDFANGGRSEVVMTMTEAELLSERVAGAATRRARAEGVIGHPQATEPPRAPCGGFRWIGQSFAHCDGCGRPAWEHEGEMRLRDGASPFGAGLVGEPAVDDAWELRPWKPGEADAIRAKWEGR
jgi:hypothetical protein